MIFDSYKALTDSLKLADPDYYQTLLNNAQLILDETKRTKKHFIAKEIGIHDTKLSIVLKLLEAHLQLATKGD